MVHLAVPYKPLMRFLYLPCLLLLFVFATTTANAQCSGSFGDPILYEDFGSGTGLGPPLPAGVTDYNFTGVPCPNDGDYSIVNYIGDCHGNSWHNIRDASNKPNGYFMLVNAKQLAGQVFYTYTADASNFCANTDYEFSAMIVNVMRTSACVNGGTRPNLTLTIETATGDNLGSISTLDIPPDGLWKKYNVCFTTTNVTSNIIVKIVNNVAGGCGNDLALDDITFSARGPVITTDYDIPGTGGNINLCEGSTGQSYTITADVAAGYRNFQWQRLNNGAWEDIIGETNSSYTTPSTTGLAAGVYQYRVAVVKDGNIGSLTCRTFSTPNTITINPKPVLIAPADQSVCTGSTLQLTATGGNTYVWRRPNMPASPPGSGSISINPATNADDGIYEVYAISDKGCISDTKQFRVTVIPPVTATVSQSTDVCAGQSASLEATGGLYYQWFPAAGLSQTDIANPVATPSQTTTYTVRVSNDACFEEKTVTVNVLQYPLAIAPEKKVIFEGQSVVLNATTRGDNIVETSWSPATFLDDPLLLTPVATPPYDMTYTLTVRSASCGESVSSVSVRVYRKVTVPNTFTPNGDGFNDVWNINQLYTYAESITTVFNRSGQQVFHSEGYNNPWNGTLNGQQLPAGTYYYTIDLKNGTKP
ncbi:MAG: gliding motility-associated C-terminal domain-containing protein, partial [Sphingobacteriaceae bacterium]